MMRIILFITIILSTCCFLGSLGDDKSEFSYDDERNWPTLFPEFCSGKVQSPINIFTKATVRRRMGSIRYSGYDTVYRNLPVTNNGHTVKLTFPENSKATISGGSLPGTFKLIEIHFHWGDRLYHSSEHKIDGQGFALEMHLVHRNIKYDAKDHLTKPDSLAVLAVLFDEFLEDEDTMSPITKALPKLRLFNSSTKINLNLRELLPYGSSSNYYRYQGSLTTPHCDEIVTWTVFGDTKEIGGGQLEEFRKIQDAKSRPLLKNFRSVQNLYGRAVHKNFS